MKSISVSSIEQLIDYQKRVSSEDNQEVYTFHELLSFATNKTVEKLKQEVLNFTDNEVQPVKEVLHKYYRLDFPASFLKEVLSEELEIAMELKSGAITDTYVRALVFGSVMRRIKAFVTCVNDSEKFNIIRKMDFPDAFFINYEDEKEKQVVAQIKHRISEVGGKILTNT